MKLEKKEFEIFCYLREIGLVKKFMCPAETAEIVAKRLVEEKRYDGAFVCEKSGLMKALYGYCGM